VLCTEMVSGICFSWRANDVQCGRRAMNAGQNHQTHAESVEFLPSTSNEVAEYECEPSTSGGRGMRAVGDEIPL
jgi:hypothetical protein